MKNMSSLIQDVEQFAARLKEQRLHEIAQDPVSFRREALRTLSASLSRGPGRPPSAAITRALADRETGRPWSEIYRLCIPGYRDLSREAQRVAEENLRAAVRARRNARGRRNTGIDSLPK